MCWKAYTKHLIRKAIPRYFVRDKCFIWKYPFLSLRKHDSCYMFYKLILNKNNTNLHIFYFKSTNCFTELICRHPFFIYLFLNNHFWIWQGANKWGRGRQTKLTCKKKENDGFFSFPCRPFCLTWKSYNIRDFTMLVFVWLQINTLKSPITSNRCDFCSWQLFQTISGRLGALKHVQMDSKVWRASQDNDTYMYINPESKVLKYY